jgi:hypothetical protein
MAIQEAEIAARLAANYEAAIKLIPPDMVDEFRRKILKLEDFKAYAKPIVVAMQFKDVAAEVKVQNWIAERFQKGNYGRRLLAGKSDPTMVYDRLLEGVFSKRDGFGR